MKREEKPVGKTPKAIVTRMSQDPMQTKLQREKILEAIAKTLLRSRAATTSIDEVARLMGRSRGTIYYYFKSRGEMLYQLQMYSYELLHDAVYPVLNDDGIPPLRRLERVIYSHTMVSCEHWQLFRATWTDIGLREAPPELARQMMQKRRRYEKDLTGLIEKVVAAEDWTCKDAKMVARHVFAVVNGISRWFKKTGRYSAAEVSDLAVQLALYGPFAAREKSVVPVCSELAEAVVAATGRSETA